MKEKVPLFPVFLVIGIFLVVFLAIKFLGYEQPKVGPLYVSVVDNSNYILPYVRVEIENLEKGYKSAAQNFGRYYDGPFFEGKHRVVVKLGNHSDEMTEVVYDKVHNFTKDMKTLGIGLVNVRQRFDIEVAKQGMDIPLTTYAERKDIFIRTYKEDRWATKKDIINAQFELKILDDIEDIFHTDILSLLDDFQYITFVRQEYPNDKWIYYVILTNLEPKSHAKISDNYIFNFSTPNIIFAVAQDTAVMNRLTYSSPTLNIFGFTIVQTTFETKDFISK